jgi:glycogen debranching enzyme
MNITEEAKKQAVKVLKCCVKKRGLYASGTKEGYTSIWSRDSNIAFLGGSLVGNEFKEVFSRTLVTLAKHQSPLGQIPNAIGVYDVLRRSEITYNTIDSSLWYIIGEYVYARAYDERNLLRKHKATIEKALRWVKYQDFSEEGLPAQLPTTDWQDAFPHKYGRTINTMALYYAALRFMGEKREAERVKRLVNGPERPHLALFDKARGYYLPWAWKDHNGDREEERWFDSLGNLLAIVTGLADRKKSLAILSYIEAKKINRPYPVKAIFPPISPKSKLWKSYFSKSDARTPYHYLNGGIWPFIGGFYISSLVKSGKFGKAREELERLARANCRGRKIVWEFNEWLDGRKGKPRGGIYQAWSAGSYIFAYESLKQKGVPFFSY